MIRSILIYGKLVAMVGPGQKQLFLMKQSYRRWWGSVRVPFLKMQTQERLLQLFSGMCVVNREFLTGLLVSSMRMLVGAEM